MSNRLDDILGDWVDDPNGEHCAALPVTDHETVKQAVRHSIEVNGIHNTGDHWQAMLAITGPVPQEILDSLSITFNQTVAEFF